MIVCEVSFEVCNKIGGIYTVISSKVAELQKYTEEYIAIGPWFKSSQSSEFEQAHIDDVPAHIQHIFDTLFKQGIQCTYGFWNISGKPPTILIDTTNFSSEANKLKEIYWKEFKIDSLTARSDFDEPMLFSTAAGMLIELLAKNKKDSTVVGQFHEWMCGFGGLYLKINEPSIRTVFTTHATMLGRTLTSKGFDLENLPADFDDITYATNMGVIEKHTAEKACAHNSDVFTTVSHITQREARIILNKKPDIITFNGIDNTQFAQGKEMFAKQSQAREKIITFIQKRYPEITNDVTIIYTSGRPEFVNKGFDTLMESLLYVTKKVVCIFFVPWKHYEVNETGICSHHIDPYPLSELYNTLTLPENVQVILYPAYLENSEFGNYYDTVAGCDLGIFPSKYEPWGYTPMESCAVGVPCITTTSTGFGEFCRQLHKEKLVQGISVLDLTKKTPAIDMQKHIAKDIDMIANTTIEEKIVLGLRARKIADLCEWKSFIKRYIQAYSP
jgi:phosphorylase/glycogen(starch) synthase